MSVVKEGLLYSKSHEWVETLPDGTARIGISDYAQDSLGDIVFVDMHPAGEEVEAEGALADVESVKAVSEIYSPVAGTIKEINEELIDARRGSGRPAKSGSLQRIPDDAGVAHERLHCIQSRRTAGDAGFSGAERFR